MKIVEDKPFNHAFCAESEEVPESLGTFPTLDDAREHLALNTVFENVEISTSRLYSEEEIKEFKEKVLDIVENELPEADDKRENAEFEFQNAKKKKEEALEMYTALIVEMKDLAAEIRKGITDVKLPFFRAFRLPYNGKYYTYVWLDSGEVVLADVNLIPENQKQELFSANETNTFFFEHDENKRQTKQIP